MGSLHTIILFTRTAREIGAQVMSGNIWNLMVKGDMNRIIVGLVCTLLLLIQCGNGADLNITSPDPSPLLLIGDTINLNISYSSTPSVILWTANESIVVLWVYGVKQWIAAGYQNRLILQEKYLSINGSTKADSGSYMVRVNDTNGDYGSFVFNVVVRESTQEIQSNDTGIYKMGENISLTIGYEGDTVDIYWNYNSKPLVIKTKPYNYISDTVKERMILKEDGSLLIYNTTKQDEGNYSITVTTSVVPALGSFQVEFYDIIMNVTVHQEPAIVDDSTPLVNLSCRAASGSGSVTWQKDGQPVNNESITILDQDLQIVQPNGTFSGNYSCNMSNPISWDFGSIQMTVYNQVENVTVTQSPQLVSEMTPLVNLSCGASSGYIEAVTWMKDGQSIDNTYNLLDGNKTLQIIKPSRKFSGNYICNISNAAHWGSSSIQLLVYDPVENVKVTQSPEKVNKTSPLVNLTCSSSSGYIEEVTWTKDGQSVIAKNAYSLLDGNRVLQITKPNETFNGIYTCNMSNAAYLGTGFLNFTVSYSPLSASSTFGMMITSYLGGILLAH